MDRFILHSPYAPTGDQPEAIEKLTEGINNGLREQTLLGVMIEIHTQLDVVFKILQLGIQFQNSIHKNGHSFMSVGIFVHLYCIAVFCISQIPI